MCDKKGYATSCENLRHLFNSVQVPPRQLLGMRLCHMGIRMTQLQKPAPAPTTQLNKRKSTYKTNWTTATPQAPGQGRSSLSSLLLIFKVEKRKPISLYVIATVNQLSALTFTHLIYAS